MSDYNIIYNCLIIVTLILSLVAFKKGHKRFLILSVLLALTSVVELVALLMIKKGRDFTWMYHLYNLFEYSLFSLFLIPSVKSKIVIRLIQISIPVFIVAGFSLSCFFYHFKDLPGLNINIEGFLLFLVCTYILFTLEVSEKSSILKNPNLWICSGILIYFGCTFFYNGVYTEVVNLDQTRATELFGIINRPLNIILYSFISIGILCLPRGQKHIIR